MPVITVTVPRPRLRAVIIITVNHSKAFPIVTGKAFY